MLTTLVNCAQRLLFLQFLTTLSIHCAYDVCMACYATKSISRWRQNRMVTPHFHWTMCCSLNGPQLNISRARPSKLNKTYSIFPPPLSSTVTAHDAICAYLGHCVFSTVCHENYPQHNPSHRPNEPCWTFLPLELVYP